MVLAGLIALLRPYGLQVSFLPDTGASWYYWQLPGEGGIASVTAWAGYLTHQLFMWGVILYGQRLKLKPRTRLRRINVIALVGNGVFITLHWLQTHLYYGALAEDVPVFSSQGSVILLLVMVLIMETPRRGLLWGHRFDWMTQCRGLLLRYHGYVFSWATLYTFWYHPMESTNGHLIGFFYVFLLMLQVSLMMTSVHTHRYWTATLETLVLFHGVLVAWLQGAQMWPMFLFGFAGMFVITTMHGLGWRWYTRTVILVGYIGAMLAVYQWRGFDKLHEVLRIPFILYLLAFVLSGLLWLGLKGRRRST
ncbi:hypothetical protein GCM10023333_20120 [Ferrimonas pelagia]|uniref:Serine active site containing 1-like protein n=2 Tax=Ferrimonas pelagia TaxID=1177826 RepID=A0ABP9EW52_9GAMM